MVTANEYNSASFVLDLETGATCGAFPDYPENQVWGAAGGLLKQKYPLACDGNEDISVNDCYLYEDGEWKKSVILPAAVEWPGSTVLNDTILWITGGYYNYEVGYNLSLLVDPFENLVVPGPPLPYEIMTSCMVNIDNDNIAMLGGSGANGGGPKTSFYTFSTNTWEDGPDLLERRNVPACSLVTLDFGRKIILVSGRNATEYLELGVDSEWQKGPATPYYIDVPTMVPVDNQQSVILFGKNYLEEYTGILKYDCKNGDPSQCSWVELDYKLPFQVDQPVALLIPDEIAPEC